MVDLDEADEESACTAGAMASSFFWLDKQYCLGVGGTLDAILEEMKVRIAVR